MSDVEGYWLGIDIGTCVTSAAIRDATSVEMVSLGRDGHDIPSVVAVTDDGVLIGEAARRRGRTDPPSVAREFKRRMGDDTPLMVGGQWATPEWLTAQLLDHVLVAAREKQGQPPLRVTLSCPATWGGFRRDRLTEAATLAGLDAVELVAEPVAAARFAAGNGRLQPGQLAAIFDLGGGTFDTALVHRSDTSHFDVVGSPVGLDRLGGLDLDQVLLGHVIEVLDLDLDELVHTPSTLAAMAQLRDDIVVAKEQLSFDTSTIVPVLLEGRQTQVRLTRSEFETLARPYIDRAIDSVEEAIASAGLNHSDIDVIVPVGGTSRVPLVAERLASRLGVPIADAANPRHAVVLGTVTPIAAPPSAKPELSVSAEPPEPGSPPSEDTVAPPSNAVMATSGTTITTSRGPARLLLIGAIAAVVVGSFALWRLAANGGDSNKPAIDAAAATDSEPSEGGSTGNDQSPSGETKAAADGFEVGPVVPSGFQTIQATEGVTDRGPAQLPQRRWQNQFDGLFHRPVGSAGILVLQAAEMAESQFLSRIEGIEPTTGATRWTYESAELINSYFVGIDVVLLLSTGDGLAGGDPTGGQRFGATLLDLETGEPHGQLDITPPSVDMTFDQIVEVLVDDNIVVATWSDGGELISSAYDLAAAQQLWEHRDPATELNYGTQSDSGVFVVFGEELLIARDLRTGARLWSTTEVTTYAVKAMGDGVIVIGGATGRSDYQAFELRTGEPRWTVAEGLPQRFAIDGEHLFVYGHGSNLYAVDLADGTIRWKSRTPDLSFASDLIRAGDDRLYLIDEESTVAAVDARNGEIVWQTTIGDTSELVNLATAGDLLIVHDRESIIAFG